MLGTALIVFREVLEAALIIGIVAAATRGIAGRGVRLAWGVAIGLAGSCAVAFGAEAIASLADGVGQEIFNASVLFVAVAMLAWHNLWMAKHGRELAANARDAGERDPQRHEGTVGPDGGGGARGAARGLGDGALPLRRLALRPGRARDRWPRAGFSASPAARSWAGFSTRGSCACRSSGSSRPPRRSCSSSRRAWRRRRRASSSRRTSCPSLAAPLWDTSAVVPNDSAVGTVLRGLVGYEAQPAGMQVVFFTLALVAIAAGMAWTKRRSGSSS